MMQTFLIKSIKAQETRYQIIIKAHLLSSLSLICIVEKMKIFFRYNKKLRIMCSLSHCNNQEVDAIHFLLCKLMVASTINIINLSISLFPWRRYTLLWLRTTLFKNDRVILHNHLFLLHFLSHFLLMLKHMLSSHFVHISRFRQTKFTNTS